MEKELFRGAVCKEETLLPFGFRKTGDRYFYSAAIVDGSFQAEIRIENGILSGKILDPSFGEEYIGYKLSGATGEFVGRVREEYKALLLSIRDTCFDCRAFGSDQANRIAAAILQQYGDAPEFLFESAPRAGVFREPTSRKWYGILMEIPRGKLCDCENGKQLVEILNLKLHPDSIPRYLSQPGFFKAYHMNKQHWITVLLDDTVPDATIEALIRESHSFCDSKKYNGKKRQNVAENPKSTSIS